LIFQTELLRAFLIFTANPILIITSLVIAFKILIRRRVRLTYSLGFFYILLSLSLGINLIFFLVSLFYKNEFLLFFLYYLSSVLVFFPFIFLMLFIADLNYGEEVVTNRVYTISLIVLGIVSILVYLFPGGITINESTNWTPQFSWTFLIFIYIMFTAFVTIPLTILITKLYHKFLAPHLKKKFRYFLLGIIFFLTIPYGVVLFNTWDEVIFKTFWSLYSLVIIILSGILIYIGIAKNIS